MFDLGATELLLIVIVAVVVIGPKDLPLAMRTAGRWIGKVRRVSAHFRSGLDAMIREAEMEEMEKKWKEQNAAIMAKHPEGSEIQAPTAESALPAPPAAQEELRAEEHPEVQMEPLAKPEPKSEPEVQGSLPLNRD